ncbi:MAG: hypothetical protein JWO56_1211 [Acidobacteria bacterium]|nr:hypothetical protein [Acidobacteriota bacterium]
MRKLIHLMAVMLVVSAVLTGCKHEKGPGAEEAFSFVVYPGAQYLPHLTEMTKQAHKVLKPGEPEPPPTAIYDTDASVDDVANFYAKSYGYGAVAPDATNNLSAAKPQAYFRAGDLQTDVQAIAPLLQQMKMTTDTSRAEGKYKAADIEPKPNRPRVTVQRPYFDVTTSQVVNRSLILMSR